MTEMNVDFPDNDLEMCLMKLQLLFVCLSGVPKREEEEMVHIFGALPHDWKMLGIN